MGMDYAAAGSNWREELKSLVGRLLPGQRRPQAWVRAGEFYSEFLSPADQVEDEFLLRARKRKGAQSSNGFAFPATVPAGIKDIENDAPFPNFRTLLQIFATIPVASKAN